MHKLFVSLAVAAALGASSVAMAAAPAATTTTGKVLAVNAKLCTVTLANEGVYVFGKGCKLSKITVGEWVTITWAKSGNWRGASKIAAATPMAGMGMMSSMMGKMNMMMMKH